MTIRNARTFPLYAVIIYSTLALALSLVLGACSGDEFAGDCPIEHDANGFPTSVDEPVGEMTEKNGMRAMVVNASAYTLRAQETKDYAPGVAAWGDRLEPGMKAIAVSRDLIPLGLGHNTPISILGLSGKYLVLDKMNKRWKHKIDILFGDDVALCQEWGKRKVVIMWAAPKD